MDIESIIDKHEVKWLGHKPEWRSAMRAALTELSDAHAIELRAYEATVQNQAERIRQLEAERVPDGWKMVPIDPTDKMMSAGFKEEDDDMDCVAIYRAMLSAAPAKEGE